MSVGNTKTQGNKGNNFPFQFRNLQLLGDISASVAPPGGLATEATLQSVLVAIQSEQEFEQSIVTDQGGVGCPTNCPTYLMVRIWNSNTHTFDPPIYYDAAGAVVVPVGPIALVNPQFVLENILSEVTSIDASLDVALSTRSSEATLLLAYAELQLIKTNTTGLATETTVAAINTKLTSVTRVPTMSRVTDNVGIAAGKRRVSLFSCGTGNATVLGAILKPGEMVTFAADGQGDTLGAISYDATGLNAELLITIVT